MREALAKAKQARTLANRTVKVADVHGSPTIGPGRCTCRAITGRLELSPVKHSTNGKQSRKLLNVVSSESDTKCIKTTNLSHYLLIVHRGSMWRSHGDRQYSRICSPQITF